MRINKCEGKTFKSHAEASEWFKKCLEEGFFQEWELGDYVVVWDGSKVAVLLNPNYDSTIDENSPGYIKIKYSYHPLPEVPVIKHNLNRLKPGAITDPLYM